MDQNGLAREWQYSQLTAGINCLTYGINCLYFDRSTNKILKCLFTMHEEYINILHVIIQGKSSLLFELQNIKNISDKDIYIKQTLRSMNYQHFFVVYTSTLESYVIVMHSENQLNVLWEGLQFFIYEANNFYSRISMMDPFKAETAMLFMDADADGSKLLDIQEAVSILKKLKINKNRPQIQENIVEINTDLYEKQNLKKPKDFALNMLTPLGFQYILQYYSLKSSLAPLFTQFCPIFKFKHKKFKKTIIDILKSQTKPLMSGIQFQQFLQKYLKRNMSEDECVELIKTFPVYDGEGKQIHEQVQFLSFHNFCNFVFSPNNSVMDPQKLKVYQDMTLPLTQYFIYSSSNTYVSGSSIQTDSQLQMYQFSLKKGCRCLELDIHHEKDQIVVKHSLSKRSLLLSDVLKTIKNICFSFNPFPLILSLQCNFLPYVSDKVAQIFKTQLGQLLFIVRKKDVRQDQTLPSPLDLKNRIILQLVGNSKRNKQQQSSFLKLITLMPTKLDFQRKGQTCWDTCQINTKDIIKFQQIEDKNLTDYCRKIMVRTSPSQTIGQIENYDPLPMFRNGVQMTCLNIQKQDKYHYFIHSKFLQNGGKGCGYLLKPNWMRSNCLECLYASSFTKQLFILKVKVFAGQKYVLADTKSAKFTLQVYLKGTKIEEQKNKKFSSEPQTQGFYSDFELQCQFSIYCLDIATLVLSIIDEKQKILSYRALPVNSIREGLRTVELLGPGMEISMNSCLLIETNFIQEKKRRRLSSVMV